MLSIILAATLSSTSASAPSSDAVVDLAAERRAVEDAGLLPLLREGAGAAFDSVFGPSDIGGQLARASAGLRPGVVASTEARARPVVAPLTESLSIGPLRVARAEMPSLPLHAFRVP
jgi:hypothetical protein